MRKFTTSEIIFIILIIISSIFILNIDKTKLTHNKNTLKTVSTFDVTNIEDFKNIFNKIIMKKHQLGFSGAILIGVNNTIAYEGYIGYENHKLGDSISSKTKFQLGSISKQFTAVAILQLYSKGLLNLNDTITKYIPNFPIKNITIHELLVHRSGLPNYVYYIDKNTTNKLVPIYNNDIINQWIKNPPIPYYSPNKRFDYSNTGYMLLASIVENITNMRFDKYLRKYIFNPLKMNNTYLYISGISDTISHSAIGYSYKWVNTMEPYLNASYGDKGIYTTTHDLFKWDQGLYSGSIIDTSILNLAFQPMGKPIRYKQNYGYGWRITQFNNLKIYYHAGWWQGFKSLLIRVPKYKLTILVLKNIKTGAMFGRNELLRLVFKSLWHNKIEYSYLYKKYLKPNIINLKNNTL